MNGTPNSRDALNAAVSYLAGMRETKPEICWAIIADGESVCIQDRGHDEGVHEAPSVDLSAAVDQVDVAPHLMDRMGAHSDDGTMWFAREHYPTRASIRTFVCGEFLTRGEWIMLRVLARYARHAPDDPVAPAFDGEYWVECGKDEPGAFPVWRVE